METEGLENVLTYEGLDYYHRKNKDYIDNGDFSQQTYTDIKDSNTNVRIDEVQNDLDNIQGLTFEDIDALTPID